MRTETDNIPGMSPGIDILQVLRPYVRHCGDERRPAWRIGMRRLLDYLLVYIAEGTGTFEIDGVSYDAQPNDLFWIPPDTLHAMEGNPPSMVCPYIHFDLVYQPGVSHWDFTIPQGMTDLSELCPLMHPKMSHPSWGTLTGRIRTFTNRRVGQLVREICSEAYHAQPFAFLRMSGLLTIALAEILRGPQGLGDEHSQHIPSLEKAAAFLREECYDRRISVECAAEQANLSESYFRRLFAAHFGCSPRTYLRQARIQRAKLLMAASDKPLSQIAWESGFATVHSFSRAFKAVEGVSPRQHRFCGDATIYTSGRTVPYSR